MTRTDVLLLMATGIVAIGGILLIYATFDMKATVECIEKYINANAKRFEKIRQDMKSMLRQVTQTEDQLSKNYTEECQQLRDEYAQELKFILNLHSDLVRKTECNRQQIDDLYNKVYRLESVDAKRIAQRNISEKYVLRRYGKRHRS